MLEDENTASIDNNAIELLDVNMIINQENQFFFFLNLKSKIIVELFHSISLLKSKYNYIQIFGEN